MRQWTAEATTWSLAIIPMNSQAGLPDAIRRLRRGLRDVRDRMARRRNRWRGGLLRWHRRRRRHGVDADHHEGIDRHEVEAVLRRRWPNAVVKELEQEAPTVAMLPGDAAAWTVPPRYRTAEDRDSCPSTISKRSPRPSSSRCRLSSEGRVGR